MTYFRLNMGAILKTGGKGAVLYDVIGRRIFLLDKEAQRLLQECENRMPVKDEGLAGSAHRFLDLMVSEGLGFYYSHPTHIDKMLTSSPINELEMLGPPPAYKIVNWSITSRCDQACHFCPASLQQPIWQACRSCVRRANSSEIPSVFDNPAHLVKQMADLGIWGIHLRGGNPLLEWERLTAILNCTRSQPHLRVGITTPGTGRAIEHIISLYRYPNVQLNVVLIGFEDRSDRRLPEANSVRSTQYKLLDTLRQCNALFSIVVVISDKTPVDREYASQWVFKRWGMIPGFAEFHPSPENGSREFRFNTIQTNRKPLLLWRNPEEFFQRTENNACVSGIMEITVDGSVKPCAGCDDDCGKIINNDLRHAIKGRRLYELWKMSKDKIEQCSDCPLGIACSDCLAAERLGTIDKRVALGYCPVMQDGDLYANAGRFEHQGFVYLLSIEKGLERCPT